MAEDVTATYSRMLTEITHGVTRMADQTATALNPLHQTRVHPGIMQGVALCVGYVTGRVQTRARRASDASPRLPGPSRETYPSAAPQACLLRCQVSAQ